MTDFADSWFDELEDELEPESGHRSVDDPAIRKEHLRSLIAKGGQMGLLASEALLAMEEREAKAEAAELAAQAGAAADYGFETMDPEELRRVLTAQAEIQREAADETWLAARARSLRAEHGDEAGEAMLVAERDRLSEMNAFLGPAGPADVPAFRWFETAKAEHARAASSAREALMRRQTIEDDAAAAEAYVLAVLAEATA